MGTGTSLSYDARGRWFVLVADYAPLCGCLVRGRQMLVWVDGFCRYNKQMFLLQQVWILEPNIHYVFMPGINILKQFIANKQVECHVEHIPVYIAINIILNKSATQPTYRLSTS